MSVNSEQTTQEAVFLTVHGWNPWQNLANNKISNTRVLTFNRMLQLAAKLRCLRLYYHCAAVSVSLSFLLHFRNSQAHGCSLTLLISGTYSLMFTNQSFRTGVPLHWQQPLTSFSGLWKCLTIPLTASPIASCIWPVFNSAKHKNISSYSFRNCTWVWRLWHSTKHSRGARTNVTRSVGETVLGCG